MNPLDYLKHHLLLLAAVALLVFGSVYGIETLIADHDAANATKYTLILQEQQKQTAVLQAQLEEREVQWAEQNRLYMATIQKLQATITARDTALDKQKQENATLSAEQAAAHLVKDTGSTNIKAADNTVVLDLPAAINVVDVYDTLNTIQANYRDVTQQLQSQQAITANLQADLDQTKLVIVEKDKELDGWQNKYNADTAKLKADARKGKLKWAVIGAIAGGVMRVVLGF